LSRCTSASVVKLRMDKFSYAKKKVVRWVKHWRYSHPPCDRALKTVDSDRSAAWVSNLVPAESHDLFLISIAHSKLPSEFARLLISEHCLLICDRLNSAPDRRAPGLEDGCADTERAEPSWEWCGDE